MNFIEFESTQKLRGGFYTHPEIAAFLVDWVKGCEPKSILEPSCGDGAFLEEIEKARIPTLVRVVGCEMDPIESVAALARTSLPIEINNVDFLKWYLFNARDEEVFDAVVGNPPFIRYQYLPKEQQLLSEMIFRDLRLPFTKHTNAWVPFVLASIHMLRPGGRLAMVVPSEILHIPHSQSLRRFLAAECSQVLILDPEEIWFADTLQGTVILLAEKKINRTDKSSGVAITSIQDRASLSSSAESYFREGLYANGETIDGKWMSIFLTPYERDLVKALSQHVDVKLFSDIASVDVGIVTGANKFFLVTDETVEEFGLHPWVFPMFGRSNHARGLIYTDVDHVDNKAAGLPSNFLWLRESDENKFPESVRRYLESGMNESLHTRFKCRTRKPWYVVPSVYAAPIAMLKRAHNYPRLVLNEANAFTTDTAYRIKPKQTDPNALVNSFVNSLTCLSAELNGRHYGGGVLELVPSEIERLLVPIVDVAVDELHAADTRYRKSDDIAFLRENDEIVLGKLGIPLKDQRVLLEAWLRLKNRRHRKPNPALVYDVDTDL